MNAQGKHFDPALLYTLSEVMALLKLSRTTVFKLIREGDLRSALIGRSRRVSAESLREFVLKAEHKTK